MRRTESCFENLLLLEVCVRRKKTCVVFQREKREIVFVLSVFRKEGWTNTEERKRLWNLESLPPIVN